MIHKRLTKSVPESKKWILLSAFVSWISLLCNVVITFLMVKFFSLLYHDSITVYVCIKILGLCFAMIALKIVATKCRSFFSFCAGVAVKQKLRTMLFEKLTSLKLNFSQYTSSPEIMQIGSEGIEQLDSYFGAYLPQFFFSMTAPVTLFIFLAPINFFASIVLFLCVPLIPISIIVIQKIAKRILKNYFAAYTNLGDSFLDNLRGLLTLKAYNDDEYQHDLLYDEAENFRNVTMHVLTMQLNSIFIMDSIAYGGTAVGIIISLFQLRAGAINFESAIFFILLCSEFFLPLRRLGSLFHIAMNGITSANRLFEFIDIKEEQYNELSLDKLKDLELEWANKKDIKLDIRNVNFSYDNNKFAIKNASLNFEHLGFYGIVGESGSGKSTIASLIVGLRKNYSGEIFLNDVEIRTLPDSFRCKYISIVSTESFLFGATVRDNFLVANENASDLEMEAVLKKVLLYDFVNENGGLDFYIQTNGTNLSGGQIQRFALARALLHNSSIYILDEAVSNIDVESEEIILNAIYELSKTKIVIFISHRLENIRRSDNIYVFKNGEIVESGRHLNLILADGYYSKLYFEQNKLERICRT